MLVLTIVAVTAVCLTAWGSFWAALAANLAMSRGAPAKLGVRWGFVLGPLGMAMVAARTRGGGRGLQGRIGEAKVLGDRGKVLADRYGTKAKRSYAAWRDQQP
jgi:hypothetical protein